MKTVFLEWGGALDGSFKINSYQLFHRTHEDHKTQHHISPMQTYMTPKKKYCYKCSIPTKNHKRKNKIYNRNHISLQVTSHVLSIQDNLLKQNWQLLCHWLLYAPLQHCQKEKTQLMSDNTSFWWLISAHE